MLLIQGTTLALNSASPDHELLLGILHRHELALTLLYDRYRTTVYTLAMGILKDTGHAEEVVQDVFYTIWCRLSGFDLRRAFSPWLLTITKHRAIDTARSRYYQEHLRTQDIDDDHLCEGASAIDTLLDRLYLQAALHVLPEEQRKAIRLTYDYGLTGTQVAAHLGIPLGTVKTRLRLALLTLRAVLRDWHAHDDTSDS